MYTNFGPQPLIMLYTHLLVTHLVVSAVYSIKYIRKKKNCEALSTICQQGALQEKRYFGEHCDMFAFILSIRFNIYYKQWNTVQDPATFVLY
jgi:hypothetical protein